MAKMPGLPKLKSFGGGAPKMAGTKTRKMPKLRPHMAFGAGAAMHQAFGPPSMGAADQAFGSGAGLPQGGAPESPGASALPSPTLPPTG